MMTVSLRVRLLVASSLLVAAACADPQAPLPEPSEVVLVVNSIESSLSVIPVNATGAAYTIPLGGTTPTPVGISARGRWALVPMGVDHAVTVVDLSALPPLPGELPAIRRILQREGQTPMNPWEFHFED